MSVRAAQAPGRGSCGSSADRGRTTRPESTEKRTSATSQNRKTSIRQSPFDSIRLCFIKTLQQRPFQHKFQGSSGDEINNKYTKIKGVRCQQAPVQIGRNGEGPAEVQESTRRQTGKGAARGTCKDSSRERPCKRSELGVRTNIREEKHE